MEKKFGGLEVKDGKIMYTLEMKVDSHELDEAQAKAEKLLEMLERIGVRAERVPKMVYIDNGIERDTDIQGVVDEFERRMRHVGR